jgi:hypothetical protein
MPWSKCTFFNNFSGNSTFHILTKFVFIGTQIFTLTEISSSNRLHVPIPATVLITAMHRLYFSGGSGDQLSTENAVFWDVTPCGSCKN